MRLIRRVPMWAGLVLAGLLAVSCDTSTTQHSVVPESGPSTPAFETFPPIPSQPPASYTLTFYDEGQPPEYETSDIAEIEQLAIAILDDPALDDFHGLAQYVLDEFDTWGWTTSGTRSAEPVIPTTWGCLKNCAGDAACLARCGDKEGE